MKRNAVSVSLVVLSLLSVPAAADPPSSGAAADAEPAWKINQRREALAKEGNALVKQARWAEAREHLRQAVDIRSDPRVLLWLGYCEEQLGHLVQAKETYLRARDEARGAVLGVEERAAASALAALDPKIPRVTLRVPPNIGAAASLDGKPVDAGEVRLDPGKHQVTAEAPGRRAFTRHLEVTQGENTVVDVDLPAPPPPPIPPPPPSRRWTTGPIVLGAGGIGLTVIGAALLGAGSRPGHVDRPMLVTGGTMLSLGAGAGVASLVWGLGYGGDRTGRAAPATLTASALPGGGWAEIQGHF